MANQLTLAELAAGLRANPVPQMPMARTDMPTGPLPRSPLPEGAAGGRIQVSAPETRPKTKAKSKTDDALARILAAVVYSPSPAYKLEPGIMPLSKLGVKAQGATAEGYPVGLDASRLKPGDLELMSMFLAKK